MSKILPIRKKEISSLSTLSSDRKFGTDGIRGPVTSTMNPLFVTKLGWAAGSREAAEKWRDTSPVWRGRIQECKIHRRADLRRDGGLDCS